MKAASLLLALLVCCAVSARADGIPFDRNTGRVTVPHERLRLTKAQRAEFTAQRRLTLTPEQHQRLVRRCPTFPTVIETAVSYRYGDCTCCIGSPYAIVLPGGTVAAISRYELDSVTAHGVRPARPPGYLPPVSKPVSAWGRFWSSVGRSGSR